VAKDTLMTDQAEPGNRQARETLAGAARLWTRRAALDIVRQSGGHTVTRPMFRDRTDLHMTNTDAEPMAGMRAVRHLEHAARGLAREFVRQAREDGRTWHEIGATLDLSASAARRGISLAEAAYDDAAGEPSSEHARRYGRTFAWTCPACRATVSDRGPCSGPADDEQGHADGCLRLADTIAAWEAEWDQTGSGR
jgi:hypothetical protein